MKKLKGKDAMLKLFSTSTVWASPRCDWNLTLDRLTCLLFHFFFTFSTESELHKDPALSINLLLLLFNGKPLVVGFTFGPLWSVMDVRNC